MSILDDREEYLKNPFFTKREYGDFTPFYITITVCSVIGFILFGLNIVFCWCSPWRSYWQNRHTGNRWIQSLWTNTPHKNPPLDLSELESGLQSTYRQQTVRIIPNVQNPISEIQELESEPGHGQDQEYMELHKRESEI